MKFIEIVRKHCREKYKTSPIKLPYEKDFLIADWASAFQAFNDGSIQDRRLYESGKWFFKRFEILDKEISTLCYEDTQRNMIRLQVGLINWECKQGNLGFENYLESDNKGTTISEISEFSAYTEGLIDSLRYSIAKVQRENFLDNTATNFNNWIDNSRKVSIVYNCLLSCFRDCLWNNWFVNSIEVEGEDIDIIQTSKNYIEEYYKINLHNLSSG
jgi:hypothetical protein